MESIFRIGGTKNLKVSDIFASQLNNLLGEQTQITESISGYPDLPAMTTETRKYLFENCGKKSIWKDWPYGGIEVKGNFCGTDTMKDFAWNCNADFKLRKTMKPNWSAHHQENKSLLGIAWHWDKDKIPFIVAAFWSNNLTINDWGEVAEGKKVTNVCSLNKNGLKKIYNGWIIVIDDDKYIQSLEKGTSIKFDSYNHEIFDKIPFCWVEDHKNL